MRKPFRNSLSVVIVIVSMLYMLFLAACNTSTTAASCAFVVGNGQNNSDAKLHQIIYPGQTVNVDGNTENVQYVACNSRNYIINSGAVKNANGTLVGDRSTPILATTSTGVPITIQARALWTLNESQKAMADFFNVCFKYSCSSSDDQGGDVNFATKGWNGMLAENFGPTMDATGKLAAYQVDDSIWEKHNPAQYKALGDQMAAAFADVMRANLGYSENLFCGSGNSVWSNSNNPGMGNFTCTPVRIVVDDVELDQSRLTQNPESQVVLNKQRLANAKALYGSQAEFWLGLMDAIDRCKAAGVTCVFNIGGTNSVPVVKP